MRNRTWKIIGIHVLAACFAQPAVHAADVAPNVPRESAFNTHNENHPQVVYEVRVITSSIDCVNASGSKWHHVRVPTRCTTDTNPQVEPDQVPTSGRFESQAANAKEIVAFATAFTTAADTQAAIQAIASGDKSKLIFSPKVTAFDGSEWSVGNTVSRPFVVGLTASTDVPNATEPVLETIDEGIEIRGIPLDTKLGQSKLSVRLTRIDRVELTAVDRELESETVLQRPIVEFEAATYVLDLADNGTAVIAFRETTSGRLRSETEWRYVIVTKRNLPAAMTPGE